MLKCGIYWCIYLFLGLKAINSILTGDSDVDRQSGGETFAFLALFGALAAAVVIAATTDIFDDLPIIGDVLGGKDSKFYKLCSLECL